MMKHKITFITTSLYKKTNYSLIKLLITLNNNILSKQKKNINKTHSLKQNT